MTGYKLSAAASKAETARRHWNGLEKKEIIGTGSLGAWSGASRQDGSNFRTNMVTLAQFSDSISSSNPVGLSATWACVNLLAGTIASLQFMVYRTGADGTRTVAKDHPLYYVLHDSPNYDQAALDFWEIIAAGIELQGNAYASIERRGNGEVYSLTPVRPDLMTVTRKSNGFLEYSWTENGARTVKDGKNVLHIRGPFGDAVSGVSTLTANRSVFAGAMAADTAAQSTFANGLRPSGTFNTGETLSKEQRQEFNGHLQQNFTGAVNAGRPMLMDRGMTWQQINLTPEDAQMLDSRKFSGEEICRIFGVPPAMVGYGDAASNWGTGKEVDVLGFQKFTLRKRLKRIEQAVMKQLLTPADRAQGITVEFNLDSLLRGDTMSRYEAYEKSLKNKWQTINEVRAIENLPPVPWGDRPWGQEQDIQLQEDGSVPPADGQEENQ
jgi:HK97 family phage portal protein